jgi:Ribbon-helix-helix protein, copG family
MRTTLDLPDALLRQLKAKAALEGTSLKALMRRAWLSAAAAVGGDLLDFNVWLALAVEEHPHHPGAC